jgi:alcohol dehydrogenase
MNEKNLKFEFNVRTRAKFGTGEALNLGKYLKDMSFKKIGLVADPGVANTDYFRKIIAGIKKESLKLIVWNYDLKSEPDYDSLDRIKKLFFKGNKPLVECFVGIGGGSVLDFTKGLATLAANPGPSRKYRGFPKNIKPSLPNIALPTTAGTGSELTFNASFIDWKEGKKMGINTLYNYPVLAIIDPNLLLSCPRPIMVSAGADILVHTMEGYMAKDSDTLTRIFASQGFRLAFNNLARAIEKPKDLEAKAKLQLAAYIGGLTLLGSGGGPTGALSYPLGVHFKVPHGIAGGVFLPHIIRYNAQKGYDFSDLYDLIEGADKSLDRKSKSLAFAEKFSRLFKRIGVPWGLKGLGVDKSNVKILLKESENFAEVFNQNPVPLPVKEVQKLIIKLTLK